MAVFQVSLGQPVPSVSFTTCSRRKPLKVSGRCFTGQTTFHHPTNSEKALKEIWSIDPTKIQIGLTFWVPAYPGCPGIRGCKMGVCIMILKTDINYGKQHNFQLLSEVWKYILNMKINFITLKLGNGVQSAQKSHRNKIATENTKSSIQKCLKFRRMSWLSNHSWSNNLNNSLAV